MCATVFPKDFDFCNRTISPGIHLCNNAWFPAFIVRIWHKFSTSKDFFPGVLQRVFLRELSFFVYNGRLGDYVISPPPHFISGNTSLAILLICRATSFECGICKGNIFVDNAICRISRVFICLRALLDHPIFSVGGAARNRDCVPVQRSSFFAYLCNSLSGFPIRGSSLTMAKPLAGELGGIPGGSTGTVHTAAGSLGKVAQALPGVSQPDRRGGGVKTGFFLDHPCLFPLAHIALFGALHLTQFVAGVRLAVPKSYIKCALIQIKKRGYPQGYPLFYFAFLTYHRP